MSTFVLIAIAVVILIGLLVAFAARRPNEFRIERRMVIPASAEAIFPLVNDLAAWRGWSPWEKKIPPCSALTARRPRAWVPATSGWAIVKSGRGA